MEPDGTTHLDLDADIRRVIAASIGVPLERWWIQPRSWKTSAPTPCCT